MARLKEMSCELGLLERTDGSARLVQWDTSVLCGVYGPAEVKNSKELCDRCVVIIISKDLGIENFHMNATAEQ